MYFEYGQLIANAVLTKKDFDEIAKQLGITPGVAYKKANSCVAARIVRAPTTITTVNLDGSVQSKHKAQQGDYIITRLKDAEFPHINVNGEKDQWVLKPNIVKVLYKSLEYSCAEGTVMQGVNQISFITLPQGGQIIGPWGGGQKIKKGVLVYSMTTDEVYLNDHDGFKSFTVKQAEQRI